VLYYWLGISPLFKRGSIYEGYDKVLSLKTIESASAIENEKKRICIKHGLIDHFLQYRLMPYEAEMRTWMQGAAAYVDGKKIYIREIIPYCQKSSNHKQRLILQKEVSALCKFLKPFLLNYWEMLLRLLREELGYKDYLEYCTQKKGIDYIFFYELGQKILNLTDKFYYELMQDWAKRRYGLMLEELTRFDAINLLSLGEFDSICPLDGIRKFIEFLKDFWKVDVNSISGFYLDISDSEKKSAQAMSFIIQIPEEIYVVIRPVGGWIDIETIAHELGHGISAVYTDPDLPLEDRDLATNYIISEIFAFLMQNIVISRPFLIEILKIKKELADIIYYHKVLKDLSVFRRYAAKFITEYEIFSEGDISNGDLYSEYLSRYTGFYYQPESHLFDIVPELYCLDYVIGWIAEAILEKYLRERYGEGWMFNKDAVEEIKGWWRQGNKYDVFQFLEKNGIGEFGIDPIIDRWERVLCRKKG